MLIDDLRARRRRALRDRPTPSPYARPDIQGMRAIAVLLVFADHLIWPKSGGFVGVDVFFVISGYLITGLLVREGEKHGHPSIREFYARRVRRIIPVAIVVLVATNYAAHQVFSMARADDTRTDSIWALLFGANIHFSAIGTDYFQKDRPPSPVQHFWSLSVEEQFYVVWPLLIIVAFFLAHRLLRANGRALVLPLAVAGTAASLLWCIHQTNTNVTVAYFSTTARAWELGVGAILAISQDQISRLPSVVRSAGAWAGLTAVAASTVLISDKTPFPGTAAILPVVGAGLLLAADNPRQGPGRAGLLNNPVAGYIGDLSYSIYLWHFPVIILAEAYYVTKSTQFYLMAGLLPFALSILSYHLLEDPIRSSTWFSKGKPRRPGDPRRSPADWARGNRPILDRLLVFSGVVTVVVVTLVTIQSNKPVDLSTLQASQPIKPVVPSDQMTVARLQERIGLALKAKSWPQLYPSIDKAVVGGQSSSEMARCAAPDHQDDPCSWGPSGAPHKALVLGDSIAMTYLTPLQESITSRPDWNMTAMALYGCLFGNERVTSLIPEVVKTCNGQADREVAYAARLKPDVIFVSYSYEVQLDTSDYAASTRALYDRLRPLTKKIVFIAPPPADKAPSDCYTPRSRPADCVSTLTSGWKQDDSAQRAVTSGAGVQYINTLPLFCDPSNHCPIFVDSTPVKRDQKHMTPQYEDLIGVSLNQLLVRAKVLPKG